ncbi:hypothetical protein E2C01_013360 [Portunus trituberculatus]|uniref:Secreted protein n=1 Tax=Portunus trituberculatus TaxID=210409 RepID=A0A5B7DGW4_PORTR|nr:hypothetical protein [Portunus trituberculatus]
MVSRGVAVAAAVAVVLSVVATVRAEPGLFKGGCRPHVKYVPHYTTVLQKVSNACSERISHRVAELPEERHCGIFKRFWQGTEDDPE